MTSPVSVSDPPTSPADSPPSEPAPAPLPRRPRLLLPLAIFGFLYGTIGIVSACSTFISLTGPREIFESAFRENAARLFGPGAAADSPEQLQRVADRKSATLWSRRGVLVPLAGANGIAAMLVLLGSIRAAAWGRATKRGTRSAWGRSAWQLGALIGLPCVVMETIVGYLGSRDFIAALGDLSDPLSLQQRAQGPLQSELVLWQGLLTALYLVGVARYLASDAVVRYCADEPRK